MLKWLQKQLRSQILTKCSCINKGLYAREIVIDTLFDLTHFRFVRKRDRNWLFIEQACTYWNDSVGVLRLVHWKWKSHLQLRKYRDSLHKPWCFLDWNWTFHFQLIGFIFWFQWTGLSAVYSKIENICVWISMSHD